MYNYNCPICKSKNIKIVLTFKNRPYSIFWKDDNLPTLNLKVAKCSDCDFLFQASAYKKKYSKIMSKIYNNYFVVGDMNKNFPINKKNFNTQLKSLKENINFKNINSVLDIGSSRGDFLYHLKDEFRHLNILGLEPSNLNFVGIPTIKAFFDKELFLNKFDLIIIRNVLEHIKNPLSFLKDVKSILNKNAKVFIEVPNTIRDFKDRVEVFTPDHVNYFTLNSLSNLIHSSNLKVEYFIDSDNKPLYMIVSNKRENINLKRENITPILEEYLKDIKKSIDLIKKSKRKNKIVFYGASNLFIWAYSLMSEYMNLKNITIADNSKLRVGKKILNHKIVDFNNLKRENNYLFILCSSNRNIIKSMKSNINSKFSDVKIMNIWGGKLDKYPHINATSKKEEKEIIEILKDKECFEIVKESERSYKDK